MPMEKIDMGLNLYGHFFKIVFPDLLKKALILKKKLSKIIKEKTLKRP